ncbi:MAG: class C beta-lactamase-related serine hydrolase [Chitinophagaceae bacterium]|nr:MAG: class C beta-lactamase-related serine hydrolase [Chitinophagaceae bacterium]
MRKLLLLAATALALASCHVLRAYRYRHFNLGDLDKLDAAPLRPSAGSFSFPVDTLRYPRLTAQLDSQLLHSRTYAFLVIRNDTILYERYFGSVTDSTRLPSFSVAKSVTGSLVARALEQGFIKSLDEPVTRYLPELGRRDAGFHSVTIRQVLDMRSGVASSENYGNPFSDVLKLGFARNASKPALKVKTGTAPGNFEYKSVNTQLLALIVERATGRKLQDYLQEQLWTPLGMEHPATWNTDKQNTVRAFCCLNLAARDYARFGRLYLNEGMWQGKQLLSREWIRATVSVDSMDKYEGYHNQWWSGLRYYSAYDSAGAAAVTARHTGARLSLRSTKEGRPYYLVQWRDGAYHAEGILGQYVYVNPAKKLLIVRLGHNWSHPRTGAEGFIYSLGASF